MRAVIEKYAGQSFRYGADCCQFVGECVESLTGDNPMKAFSYSDESEAYEIINSYGSLEKAITATLGEPYDGFKDGDVCLIEQTGGRQIAAVAYENRVIARVKSGLMDYPRGYAKKVWCT